MIFTAQYKSKSPMQGGNTYKRQISAGTDAEAWELGITLGRSGYRLISIAPALELVEMEGKP